MFNDLKLEILTSIYLEIHSAYLALSGLEDGTRKAFLIKMDLEKLKKLARLVEDV